MTGHPYRFPGKPDGTFAYASGDDYVVVAEFYQGYEKVERRWPIEDYRANHRLAPQDFLVRARGWSSR